MPKYSWNLQMLSIIIKFKNWKVILKNSWKIGMPFGRRSWNIGTPYGTLVCQVKKLALLFHVGTPLARWHTKLKNWHGFGALACLLARWQVKMKRWHAFGTLAHGHVDHAGTNGKHDMRFSKLMLTSSVICWRQ